jgi:hypothetical protein
MFPRLTDAEWAERGAILQRLADELDRHQRERERERGTHHPRFALPPAKPRSSRPGCIISYIDKVHARLQRDERRRQRHANGFI